MSMYETFSLACHIDPLYALFVGCGLTCRDENKQFIKIEIRHPINI